MALLTSYRSSRTSLPYLLILLGLSIITAYYRDPVIKFAANVKELVIPSTPCSQPISYALGAFDPRFKISRSQFLDDVARATNIWDTASGRIMFVPETATGTDILTIDLVYDYRQSATTKLQGIGGAIKSGSSEYDALKAKYLSLDAAYNSANASLQAHTAKYLSDKSAYEQQVAYWNSRGGAPAGQYSSLESQRIALNAEANDLNSETATFNKLVDTTNSTVAALNLLGKQLNLNVKEYNTVGSSVGSEFNEGEYISDERGQRIEIYQFDNNDKLVRVLAHEFGHAIGLSHVDDPKSIMYRANIDSNIRPTAADIAELKTICKLK